MLVDLHQRLETEALVVPRLLHLRQAGLAQKRLLDLADLLLEQFLASVAVQRFASMLLGSLLVALSVFLAVLPDRPDIPFLSGIILKLRNLFIRTGSDKWSNALDNPM